MRRTTSMPFAILIAMLTVLPGSGVLAQGDSKNSLTDQQISDKIEDELLFDQAVQVGKIDVSTSQGVVQLEGSVDNLLAKQRAARIAKTIRGVRAVVNEVTIQPSYFMSDSEIESRISKALLGDPAADSYEITPTVSGGIATLSGTVDSWQEKRLAAKVASGVSGVQEVVNDIDIDYPLERTDSEIASEVTSRLQWDVLVDDELIDVLVEDANVTLRGEVGSSAEKDRAYADAWVTGVDNVDASSLKIEDWAEDENVRHTAYTVKMDADVTQAVTDALLYDPRVKAFNVTASTLSGVVTLRGNVDNLKAKQAAEMDARNTVGVTAVDNRIRVRPTATPTDSEIEAEIQDAFLRDPYLNRFDVSTSVVDGTAHLYGTVDNYFERSQAQEVAARVKGVVDIENHLEVDFLDDRYSFDPYVDEWDGLEIDLSTIEPLPTNNDLEVKESIQSELWWSPFVNSNQVKVKVENGIATLTGTVDSTAERQSAVENAYEGGASWVVNRLELPSQTQNSQ